MRASVSWPKERPRSLRHSRPFARPSKSATKPTGTLRINVPRVACKVGLPKVLAEYAKRHPSMRVEVVVDERRVDLLRDGFDAGIRAYEAVHKDMIRVRMSAPVKFVVVGSKRYLARHGRPKHPRDLVARPCLGWRSLNSGSEYRWEFEQRGRAFEVAVNGPLLSNDTELLVSCAVKGMGLAFVAEPDARREIEAGHLETVLDGFTSSVPGLFLYYPASARTVAKVRAFATCAREITKL